jgi:Mn-dependent DtxR family transcriptional regulator
MIKKEKLEKKIKKVLIHSKGYVDGLEIAEKVKANPIKVFDVLNSLERRGLVKSKK